MADKKKTAERIFELFGKKAGQAEEKVVKGFAIAAPGAEGVVKASLARRMYTYLRTTAFQKAASEFKEKGVEAVQHLSASRRLSKEADALAKAGRAADADKLRKEATILAEKARQAGADDLPNHIVGWLGHQGQRMGKKMGDGGPKTAQAWLEQQVALVKAGKRPSIRLPRQARLGATGPGAAPAEVKEWLKKAQGSIAKDPNVPLEAPPAHVQEAFEKWFEQRLTKPPAKSILNPPGYDIGHKEALVLGMGKEGVDPNRLSNLRWELATQNRARGSLEKSLAERRGIFPK